MTVNELEVFVEIHGDPGTLKADGFDDCIVGIDSKQRLVYDIDKIVGSLAQDMDYEDALEFFYYNIEGAYMGEHTPVFIHTP